MYVLHGVCADFFRALVHDGRRELDRAPQRRAVRYDAHGRDVERDLAESRAPAELERALVLYPLRVSRHPECGKRKCTHPLSRDR
jgi:hypothetical protein